MLVCRQIIDSRKDLWLTKLQKQNQNWEDGDIGDTNQKTADLVNNDLAVVIELKQDVTYSEPNPGTSQVTDIQTMSNRLKSHANDSNKKFRNYRGYKTLAIIETEARGSILKHILTNGIKQILLKNSSLTTRDRNVFLSSNTESVGGYLLCSWSDNKTYYFKNPYALPNITLTYEELLNIIDIPRNNLEEWV